LCIAINLTFNLSLIPMVLLTPLKELIKKRFLTNLMLEYGIMERECKTSAIRENKKFNSDSYEL